MEYSQLNVQTHKNWYWNFDSHFFISQKSSSCAHNCLSGGRVWISRTSRLSPWKNTHHSLSVATHLIILHLAISGSTSSTPCSLLTARSEKAAYVIYISNTKLFSISSNTRNVSMQKLHWATDSFHQQLWSLINKIWIASYMTKHVEYYEMKVIRYKNLNKTQSRSKWEKPS